MSAADDLVRKSFEVFREKCQRSPRNSSRFIYIFIFNCSLINLFSNLGNEDEFQTWVEKLLKQPIFHSYRVRILRLEVSVQYRQQSVERWQCEKR